MLIKNKLTEKQRQLLPQAIQKFLSESKQPFNTEPFVYNTIRNISIGILKQAEHDIWICGDIDLYCLCKPEIDADGEKVYTTYQLWINPELRDKHIYKQLGRFLKFYAQKNGYKRWYVGTSRLDHIQAYARGLGKGFKAKSVIFAKEL